MYFKPTKNQITYTIIGILALFVLIGGGKAYKYHKEQIKPLDSLKTVLQKRDKYEAINISNAIDSIKGLTLEGESYYYDYLRERQKRINAEQRLKDIVKMRFKRAYLDSLANFYTYE